jgi:exonuclease VII large subunit
MTTNDDAAEAAAPLRDALRQTIRAMEGRTTDAYCPWTQAEHEAVAAARRALDEVEG